MTQSPVNHASSSPTDPSPNQQTDPPTNQTPILDVRDLRVVFPSSRGPVIAIDGITFNLMPGASLGLVGESGSGKTTAGRAILRLIEPTSGSVNIAGTDIAAQGPAALRALRRKAQMIFQDPAGSLNPRHKLWRTITEPRAIQNPRTHHRALRDAAVSLLDHVGLPRDFADRYPHQLSGGQRQRVAIARALSVEPALIVCDEPTSALDVSIQAQIINLLMDLQRERGIAYLFISHDMAVVRHVCPNIAVMKQGRIVEQGTREKILGSPEHPYTQSLIKAVPKRRAIAS